MTTLTVTRPFVTPPTPLWVHLFYAAASAAMIAAAPLNLPPGLHAAVRGLPLATLALAALVPFVRGDRRAVRFFVALGLAASMAGDVVIVHLFLAGIGTFLTAHVLYIVAMGLPRGRLGRQAVAFVPAAVLWGVMYQVITPRVPAELYVPVVVYLTVITLMLTRALSRVLVNPRERAFVWMLVGAAFFVASDSLLAINRWVAPLPRSHVWILGTYLSAQWCIFRSLDE